MGQCLSYGALEQAGKVGDIRDTYLLCGLRDRVMMIPEQVRRKLAQGIGPSFGLVLMVALGYNEQLGATQPFEVALKMRYPVLFASAENESPLRVEKHSGNMVQLSNQSTVR